MSALTAITLGLMATFTNGSSLVATSVIRAGDPVTASNSKLTTDGSTAGSEEIFGREVRRTVYVGQSITLANTRTPLLVKRNQVVSIKYIRGTLEITTSGRAMGEASLQETVTVLNQDSKQLVHGIVQADGWVLVQ